MGSREKHFPDIVQVAASELGTFFFFFFFFFRSGNLVLKKIEKFGGEAAKGFFMRVFTLSSKEGAGA